MISRTELYQFEHALIADNNQTQPDHFVDLALSPAALLEGFDSGLRAQPLNIHQQSGNRQRRAHNYSIATRPTDGPIRLPR